MEPIRVQRKRTKGWRMPENTVYVGRPTKYGNTFFIGDVFGTENNHDAVAQFESILKNTMHGLRIVAWAKYELKGKNLACFCALDKPCHADILLKLANE